MIPPEILIGAVTLAALILLVIGVNVIDRQGERS